MRRRLRAVRSLPDWRVHIDGGRVDVVEQQWVRVLTTTLSTEGWDLPWHSGEVPIIGMKDVFTDPLILSTVRTPHDLTVVSEQSVAHWLRFGPFIAIGVLDDAYGRYFDDEQEAVAYAATNPDVGEDIEGDAVRVLTGTHPDGGHVLASCARGSKDVYLYRSKDGDRPGVTASNQRVHDALAVLAWRLGC